MSGLYLAPDGFGEPTIWRHRPEAPDRPVGLVSAYEIDGELWGLLLQHIPTTPPKDDQ